jgi:hypothetical protein
LDVLEARMMHIYVFALCADVSFQVSDLHSDNHALASTADCGLLSRKFCGEEALKSRSAVDTLTLHLEVSLKNITMRHETHDGK